MNILQRLRETYGSSAKDTPQWTERERRHHLEVAAMEMKKQQEAQATGELDASSDVPLPSGGARPRRCRCRPRCRSGACPGAPRPLPP